MQEKSVRPRGGSGLVLPFFCQKLTLQGFRENSERAEGGQVALIQGAVFWCRGGGDLLNAARFSRTLPVL